MYLPEPVVPAAHTSRVGKLKALHLEIIIIMALGKLEVLSCRKPGLCKTGTSGPALTKGDIADMEFSSETPVLEDCKHVSSSGPPGTE